jgi:hypothetical protein
VQPKEGNNEMRNSYKSLRKEESCQTRKWTGRESKTKNRKGNKEQKRKERKEITNNKRNCNKTEKGRLQVACREI